jgi:hypothetical protein
LLSKPQAGSSKGALVSVGQVFHAPRRNNSRNPQKPRVIKMSMKSSDTIGILAFLFCIILLLSAGWMVWKIVEYATSEPEIPRLTPR